MQTESLENTLAMLRELLSELRKGEPDARWRLRHRIAKTIVGTLRVEADYAKLKAKNPKVNIAFLEPGLPLTPAQKLLFKHVIDAHLAIHRRLKALREGR